MTTAPSWRVTPGFTLTQVRLPLGTAPGGQPEPATTLQVQRHRQASLLRWLRVVYDNGCGPWTRATYDAARAQVLGAPHLGAATRIVVDLLTADGWTPELLVDGGIIPSPAAAGQPVFMRRCIATWSHRPCALQRTIATWCPMGTVIRAARGGAVSVQPDGGGAALRLTPCATDPWRYQRACVLYGIGVRPLDEFTEISH